jgi:hypothetical protein
MCENVKMDLRETGMETALDSLCSIRDEWQALMNMAMNLKFQKLWGIS